MLRQEARKWLQEARKPRPEVDKCRQRPKEPPGLAQDKGKPRTGQDKPMKPRDMKTHKENKHG